MILEAKLYAVGCSSCSLATNFCGSPEAAEEEAEDAGWHLGDTQQDHHCPECWAARMPRLRIVG